VLLLPREFNLTLMVNIIVTWRLPTFDTGWFLAACSYGMIAFVLMTKILKFKLTVIISCFTYLASYSLYYIDLSSAAHFVQVFKSLYWGCFVRSLLFFCIGNFFSSNEKEWLTIKRLRPILVGAFILFVTEICIMSYITDSTHSASETLMLPIISFLLFYRLLQTKMRLKHAKALRYMSVWIYISHIGITRILQSILFKVTGIATDVGLTGSFLLHKRPVLHCIILYCIVLILTIATYPLYKYIY
jgi:hypothetical protein